MPQSKTWVVKIGGAMMRAPELGPWLRACGQRKAGAVCVVAPGGGALADQVRSLQATWRFDDRAAHALAIDAMRINARVLKLLAPRASMKTDLSAMARAVHNGHATIWLPAPAMVVDGLPETWAVTSDTLALHLARRLGADALLLVKSVDPELLCDASATQCAQQGLIDAYFPRLLAHDRVPTRLVSKYHHAEFENAVRSGELCGAQVKA